MDSISSSNDTPTLEQDNNTLIKHNQTNHYTSTSEDHLQVDNDDVDNNETITDEEELNIVLDIISRTYRNLQVVDDKDDTEDQNSDEAAETEDLLMVTEDDLITNEVSDDVLDNEKDLISNKSESNSSENVKESENAESEIGNIENYTSPPTKKQSIETISIKEQFENLTPEVRVANSLIHFSILLYFNLSCLFLLYKIEHSSFVPF